MNSWERGGSSPESKPEKQQRIEDERQLLEKRSGKQRGVAKVLLLASVLSVGGFWAGSEFNNHKDMPNAEAIHSTEIGDSPKATQQKYSHEGKSAEVAEHAAVQEKQESKHLA